MQSAISNSFGIRCPNTLTANSTASTFRVFDYESSCQWNNMPSSETAFCGKCSLQNNALLFSNTANNTLAYNYVLYSSVFNRPINFIVKYLKYFRYVSLTN